MRLASAVTVRRTAPFTAVLVVLSLLGVVLSACTYLRGGGMPVATVQQKGPVPTGAPLVLGFVTQEDSPTGSFPETRRAAEAAVAYVNEDLGGVEGRPLRLRTCRTDGSPESSQACARQLLAVRPLAVVGGVDFGAGAALPAYEKAKVPYVSGSPQLLAELIDPNSYALTGGTAAELLGTADYLINTLHVHKVNALYVDLPGLLASATASAKTIFDKKKIANRLVAEKADAADFTPALTSATAGKPDAVVIVFPAASCQRILQARRRAGHHRPAGGPRVVRRAAGAGISRTDCPGARGEQLHPGPGQRRHPGGAGLPPTGQSGRSGTHRAGRVLNCARCAPPAPRGGHQPELGGDPAGACRIPRAPVGDGPPLHLRPQAAAAGRRDLQRLRADLVLARRGAARPARDVGRWPQNGPAADQLIPAGQRAPCVRSEASSSPCTG